MASYSAMLIFFLGHYIKPGSLKTMDCDCSFTQCVIVVWFEVAALGKSKHFNSQYQTRKNNNKKQLNILSWK